jgi:hypothetical protein
MQEILSYSYLCAYDKSVLEVIYSEVYVVFFQKQLTGTRGNCDSTVE